MTAVVLSDAVEKSKKIRTTDQNPAVKKKKRRIERKKREREREM